MTGNKHTDPVLEAIEDVARLSTDLIPLAAIWLEKPLQMEGKRSIRIAEGDKVRVEWAIYSWIVVDVMPAKPATHVITACRGTVYSTLLEVDVKDLKTGELLTIKL